MITYLGKLGELTLKGSNKNYFEKLLKDNTRDSLKSHSIKDFQVTLRNGRLYVVIQNDEDATICENALSHLTGITGFSKCFVCDKDIVAIKNTAIEMLCDITPITFKVKARREDKAFPFNSYNLECEVGESVLNNNNKWRVDVHNPAIIINIEVRDKCYLYIDSGNSITNQNTFLHPQKSFLRNCFRGLPVGCSGKALVMLSGGLDSPVATHRLIRRGMMADCVYFESPPYTSNEAREKVKTLTKIISQWTPMLFLNIIPFTDVQLKLKESSPKDWVTMMLRVCMMKAANLVAARCHASCIATGESLSQVASQTIDNLKVTENFCDYQLLRPLIAMDKEEIINDARNIGTYDTSILPYEDCCVLFSPQHPILHGTKEKACEIYGTLQEKYDIDTLIDAAYKARSVIRYSWGNLIE